MKYIPGTVVTISNLSKASHFLYKKFLKQSPLLICPCHIKRDKIFTVIDCFDNGVVLLQLKNSNNLTMVYSKDLTAIYEP